MDEESVLHIHGSLREDDEAPVLGHGNEKRINDVYEKRHEAEEAFDDKAMSIYKVVGDYYERTYKDISMHMPKLERALRGKEVDEILVIGHSLAGVDVPYFKTIDTLTMKKAKWKVYYYNEIEQQRLLDSLLSCGVDSERIEMIKSTEFFNL